MLVAWGRPFVEGCIYDKKFKIRLTFYFRLLYNKCNLNGQAAVQLLPCFFLDMHPIAVFIIEWLYGMLCSIPQGLR